MDQSPRSNPGGERLTDRSLNQDQLGTATAEDSGKSSKLAARACDACRARRRKCVLLDSTSSAAITGFIGQTKPQSELQPQPLCTGCSKLGIHCSFDIPTRSRGPKKRRRSPVLSPQHADNEPCLATPQQDASKASEVSGRLHRHTTNQASPATSQPTPDYSTPCQAGPLAHRRSFVYKTDQLCSRSLFLVIMNDYLERIFPLVPIVHRPTFTADLASDLDLTSSDFLCLVVSLAALTIGLLPSRFEFYHSIAPELAGRFRTRTAMVSFCAEMCIQQRSADYWDNVDHQKWAVCYSLAIGVVQIGQINRSRMLEVEAAQLSRLLGTHRISEYEGLNFIETQMRKKAFWLQFYGYAHGLVQPGRREQLAFLDRYTLREVDFKALVPLDVEDEMITKTAILHSDSFNTVSTPSTNASWPLASADQPMCIASFIATSKIFFKGVEDDMFHGTCDCGTTSTPKERLSRLQRQYEELRYILDDLPPPLRQWVTTEAGQEKHIGFDGDKDKTTIEYAQRYVVRANLHITHLWLQNVLLERMDAILQQQRVEVADPSATPYGSPTLSGNWIAREDICRQMLQLLHSIPLVYLEPNGLYLAYKVRDVAVALLDCPYEANAGPSRRAAEYIQDFTSMLSQLDRSEIVITASLRSWVDKGRDVAV